METPTNMYEGLNKSLYFDNTRIQIESSSRCNLSCPGCSRTKWLASGKAGDIRDMEMSHFHALMRPENGIKRLTYNMALSDPIFSGSFMQQMEYMDTLEHRPEVTISTNGSGRKQAWWLKFAGLLRDRDVVEFAIDGLEDTNHLYRINSDWDSIMLGVKTLRANWKGRMGWRYVVFEHNYHQLVEAKELARELGFKRFRPILGDARTPEHMLLKSKTWAELENDLS